MIRYYKLFDLLNRRNMKKTDLLEIISSPTLAKLSKGENITTDIIDKICLYLNCQPNDIMEVIISETERSKSDLSELNKLLEQNGERKIKSSKLLEKPVISKEKYSEMNTDQEYVFEGEDVVIRSEIEMEEADEEE